MLEPIKTTAVHGSSVELLHAQTIPDCMRKVALAVGYERHRTVALHSHLWPAKLQQPVPIHLRPASPCSPDHGQDILDDLGRKAQPGYPSIGRLKGLAELRGVIAGLQHGMQAQ